jgi:hypothetical protein
VPFLRRPDPTCPDVSLFAMPSDDVFRLSENPNLDASIAIAPGLRPSLATRSYRNPAGSGCAIAIEERCDADAVFRARRNILWD